MKRKIWFQTTFLFLIMVICAGCTRIAGDPKTQSGFKPETITYGDRLRSYLVQFPVEDAVQPWPVILALHGGGGTARSMCAMPGGLAEHAKREGYLLVCPQGYERHWNDGRGIQTWSAHAEGIDDVGFLIALIEALSQQYPIKSDKVFATGISNGGQMSYRFACEQSHRVSAISAVVASMAEDLNCEPSDLVSVLVINGTEDPLVPYEGGEIKAIRRGLGVVRSTQEVLTFWASQGGCDQTTEFTELPDRDPGDQTRIHHTRYQGCAAGVAVELYEVIGGGHTWPGANQYLPEWLIGRLSKDIEASEIIVDFFSTLK